MKIALIGYGRMGKTIDKLAREDGEEVVLRIGADNTLDLTTQNLQAADVAIEFSQPEAAAANIEACLEAGIPVVSGTTGWLEEWARITELVEARQGAFFYAANFSVGVNLFFALNRYLAELMNHWSDYDVGVTETHHRFKLDYPSGTGLVLAEDILQRLARKERWVKGPAAEPSELGVSSQRFGQVPGTHEVNYDSLVDGITIRHTARSREGFAAGALLAAGWLIGKQGVFGMDDLLFAKE